MSPPTLVNGGAVPVSACSVDVDVIVTVLAGECVADEVKRSVGSAETVRDDIAIGFGRGYYVV
jgi:hypothetical protein